MEHRIRPVVIFEFSDGCVTDWIAARTLKEAKACYVDHYGAEQLSEIEKSEPGIRALAPSELDKLTYRDEDDGKSRTFADQLRRIEAAGDVPAHFACTEF